MSGLLIYLSSLMGSRPKSWEDTASFARLFREMHASFVRDGVDRIIHVPPAAAAANLPGVAGVLKDMVEIHRVAHQVYLGAAFFSMGEGHENPFSRDALVEKLQDAQQVGMLLESFVDTALSLTTTNFMREEGKANSLSSDVEERAATFMVDAVQAISKKYPKAIEALRPVPDTVIRVVRRENGVLPETVVVAIRKVLAFQPTLR